MTSRTKHDMFHGLFDLRLKPDGAFAEALVAAGYDARRPRDPYPTEVWRACLEIARAHRYPTLSVTDAYRELGREATEGFIQTRSGRLLTVVVPLLSPLGYLKRLQSYFTMGRTGEIVGVRFLEELPGHAVMAFHNPAAVPGGYVAGLIDVGFERLGITWTIEVNQQTAEDYELHLEWQER